MKNKVTSKLSEQEKQELYKNARAKAWYDDIWKTVGKCVFCDLKDKYILHEENGVVLTINIYPYIDGQMLAIPRRHIKSTNELTQLEWETMRKFGYIAKKLFKKIHGHRAMWSLVKTGILAQGTVADHLHMHFIPFDKQDLATWNYRELQHTPLENVDLYKKEFKNFIKDKYKYEQKYSQSSSLPIICDLIIVNKKGQVLFQKRTEEAKLHPDLMTLPGGHVDDFKGRFEDDLRREIEEELGVDISKYKIDLVDSRLGNMNFINTSKYVKSKYVTYKEFVWNTYILRDFKEVKDIKCGDDCERVKWLSKEEIEKEEKISEEVKAVINKI